MKLLKGLSLVGIVLSVVAHLISWASPNPLHFFVLSLPLEVLAMGLMAWLYHKNVMPLQHNADLRWFHQSNSVIHALMFLAVLSFIFHSVIVVAGLSMFVMFLLRVISSIWIYTFASAYGYSSWTLRYGEQFWRAHRLRLQQTADHVTTDNTAPMAPSPIVHMRRRR